MEGVLHSCGLHKEALFIYCEFWSCFPFVPFCSSHHTISDSNDAALQAAKEFIDETLPSVLMDLVHDGKAGTLKLFTDRSEALKDSWMVTEAVPEVLELKINLLGELDSLLGDDAILATNSSSYTPSETGKKVKNQSRLVATHYYMPPASM